MNTGPEGCAEGGRREYPLSDAPPRGGDLRFWQARYRDMLAEVYSKLLIYLASRKHVIYCCGCRRTWTEDADAEDPDCACTCSDPAAPRYEDWMTDLIAFLHARLDEAEPTPKVARRWQQGACLYIAAYGKDWQALDDYDPDRALRDVEAKRAILAEHGPANGGRDPGRCRVCTAIGPGGGAARFRAPCPTLLFLAAIYSDHPDYDPSWRPS